MLTTTMLVAMLWFGGHPSPVLANLTNEQFDLTRFAYEQAINNDINPESFIKLMECESKIGKGQKGDFDGEKYLSHGILQFQKKTFDRYSKLYGVIGNWKDPYVQITLAAQMIRDGLWRHWFNCGRIMGLDKDSVEN